jgi:hypothetical protein
MALELVQSGFQPLGQFDGADDVYLTVKGGEVATIIGVSRTGTDLRTADVANDGYVGTTRPAATTNLTSGNRPLFLVDDGIVGYGTLFGSVIGGVAGQITTGAPLGPHTAAASGKLTLWDKPGTYAITLDAVDTTSATGLVPTNATLQIGDALYATATGLVTPNNAVSFESPGASAPKIGRFLNFETNKGGALVTTPVSLVSAANSPVGQGQPQLSRFARALIFFNPPV